MPTKIGIILFPGFQLLDATGPLDAFSLLSYQFPLQLYILASTLAPVSTLNSAHVDGGSNFGTSLVPTHTFGDAKDLGLDVLLLPGGLGTRKEENVKPVVEFLKAMGFSGSDEEPRVKWMLTVCTGSEVLARTGVLDGRRATTNKKVFNEVKAQHPAVQWVPKARWVVDGNIWTSSGISAGMDLAFAWVSEVFGEEVAQHLADRSEYGRSASADEDPFAERWGAV